MNNEETIIEQPKANAQTQEKQENKSNNSHKSAKIVTAATIGGALGGGATAATVSAAMHGDGTIEQPEEEPEVKVEEDAATPENNTEPNEVTPTVDNSNEPDYTNHENADPVVETDTTAEVHPVVDSQDDAPEVQVLGVYEDVTEEGVHQTAAVLTDGELNAVVVDVDGDGSGDVIAVDINDNGQIDEGEIQDISNQGIPMDSFHEAYLAQQQEMGQQQEDMAYNTSDDAMSDYDNNAGIGV